MFQRRKLAQSSELKTEIKSEDEAGSGNSKKKDKPFSEEKQKMLQTEKVWIKCNAIKTISLIEKLF